MQYNIEENWGIIPLIKKFRIIKNVHLSWKKTEGIGDKRWPPSLSQKEILPQTKFGLYGVFKFYGKYKNVWTNIFRFRTLTFIFNKYYAAQTISATLFTKYEIFIFFLLYTIFKLLWRRYQKIIFVLFRVLIVITVPNFDTLWDRHQEKFSVVSYLHTRSCVGIILGYDFMAF